MSKPDLLVVLAHYGTDATEGRVEQLVCDGAEWRRLGGHLVSSDGRVWSLRLRRLLACGLSSHGYPRVSVGEDQRRYVHDLVLTAHSRPRRPGEVGRHLNDVKTDNRIENLSWGTPTENLLDAVRNGRQLGTKGTRHPRARLTEAAVRDIRAFGSYGFMQKDIASWYGMTRQAVSDICTRKRWPHVE